MLPPRRHRSSLGKHTLERLNFTGSFKGNQHVTLAFSNRVSQIDILSIFWG